MLAHFREFERTRVGVEAYIEPSTHVTSTTMVLIDFQGEWTRRAIPDPAAGVGLVLASAVLPVVVGAEKSGRLSGTVASSGRGRAGRPRGRDGCWCAGLEARRTPIVRP